MTEVKKNNVEAYVFDTYNCSLLFKWTVTEYFNPDFSTRVQLQLRYFSILRYKTLLKPSQNKKGRKKIPAAPFFLNTFSQLPAVKKYSKNGAAEKFFGPCYFDLALINLL